MDNLTLTHQFGIQFNSLEGIGKEFWNVVILIHTDKKESVFFIDSNTLPTKMCDKLEASSNVIQLKNWKPWVPCRLVWTTLGVSINDLPDCKLHNPTFLCLLWFWLHFLFLVDTLCVHSPLTASLSLMENIMLAKRKKKRKI